MEFTRFSSNCHINKPNRSETEMPLREKDPTEDLLFSLGQRL